MENKTKKPGFERYFELKLRLSKKLMLSDDYKERFRAEYWQVKCRYMKLHKMLVKYEANKLDFTPSCSLELLKQQKRAMGEYLNCLEIRAEIEDIILY